MASPNKDGLQVLEHVDFSDDEDDDFKYETVPEENFGDDDDDDEDISEALASLQFNKQKTSDNDATQSLPATVTQVRPSVVDDFIRNFLIKAGLKRSLEAFNIEWYEFQAKGKLSAELATPVPDIYLRNEELFEQTRVLRDQVEKMREISGKAQATWDKFRKERDFHRMHHKRVVQEKNKLIDDLKRLRDHLRSYEPTIDELKRRHEVAMKEKMMIRLERDRLKARVKVLDEQVAGLSMTKEKEREIKEEAAKARSATRSVRKHALFPSEDSVVNPFTEVEFDPAKIDSFANRKTSKGHVNAISACAFHPKKPIFATASDDETWKLWTVPGCELVMSGEGHTSWLSDLHFHPHGSHLVTSSGDSTVKVWEFAQAKCTHTFFDHTQAVWGCEIHFGGDFVVSCSMDHTIRVWDLLAGKCRQTLRGHVDSVNAVAWQPYSSNVCSASGDKTVSMWDARAGLCVQTLYGHSNSVNHLKVSNRGDMIVSSDADGVVKVWDVRMVAELGTIDVGQHPVNKLALDRGGLRAAAASDDGTIKILNLENFTLQGELKGHEGAVQCLALAPNDAYLVSGSSDSTFKVWG